jgi:hypothetical protein
MSNNNGDLYMKRCLGNGTLFAVEVFGFTDNNLSGTMVKRFPRNCKPDEPS